MVSIAQRIKYNILYVAPYPYVIWPLLTSSVSFCNVHPSSLPFHHCDFFSVSNFLCHFCNELSESCSFIQHVIFECLMFARQSSGDKVVIKVTKVLLHVYSGQRQKKKKICVINQVVVCWRKIKQKMGLGCVGIVVV